MSDSKDTFTTTAAAAAASQQQVSAAAFVNPFVAALPTIPLTQVQSFTAPAHVFATGIPPPSCYDVKEALERCKRENNCSIIERAHLRFLKFKMCSK